MCGLVFAVDRLPVDNYIEYANSAQHHRGPDHQGLHREQIGEAYVGLAHQRLAIIDLSENGAQPMTSRSSRLVMVFNGEIYNYRELVRAYGLKDLATDTDSEVALELIERLGIEEASRLFNGMWSIVVLDRQQGRLLLSRDRFGKKPLNYVQHGSGIYGASELKAFHGIHGARFKPDAVVAARFLGQSLQNVDERTWYEGVRQLPASSTGWIDLRRPEAGLQEVRRFWSPNISPGPQSDFRDGGFEELRELVTDAVRLRLNADVPVGVALSGGIDSSIIAAAADGQCAPSGRQPILFSATNPGNKEDEGPFVDIFSRHSGKDVQRLSLNPSSGEDLTRLLQRCSVANDGPLSTFSGVLFYKLMEMARQSGITVVLTGQGADEAFCGYRKYPIFEAKRRFRRNPVSSAAFMLPFIYNRTLLPQIEFTEAKRYLGITNGNILGEVSRAAFSPEPLTHVSTIQQRQQIDVERYSVPYLCHYEDRMSMAWSREVRSPFLDYRVVEYGLRIPTEMKMRSGWTKFALRKAFEADLPKEIAWRRDKQGFVNPQDKWFGKDMRGQVVEAMESPTAPIYEHGLVDRLAYSRLLKDYLRGSTSVGFRDVFAPYSLNLWLQAVPA